MAPLVLLLVPWRYLQRLQTFHDKFKFFVNQFELFLLRFVFAAEQLVLYGDDDHAEDDTFLIFFFAGGRGAVPGVLNVW